MADGKYEKSARIYDLLYVGTGIKDYHAETAELRRIIDQSCRGAKSLLDVACGTASRRSRPRASPPA